MSRHCAKSIHLLSVMKTFCEVERECGFSVADESRNVSNCHIVEASAGWCVFGSV
jgi:hypothetical protein